MDLQTSFPRIYLIKWTLKNSYESICRKYCTTVLKVAVASFKHSIARSREIRWGVARNLIKQYTAHAEMATCEFQRGCILIQDEEDPRPGTPLPLELFEQQVKHEQRLYRHVTMVITRQIPINRVPAHLAPNTERINRCQFIGQDKQIDAPQHLIDFEATPLAFSLLRYICEFSDL